MNALKLLKKTTLFQKLRLCKYGLKYKNYTSPHEELDFFKQFIGKESLCFDVGANIGNMTSLFIELGANTIAFEPQPFCCKVLTKRFKNNPSYALERIALGEKAQKATMHVSENLTISTLSEKWLDAMSNSILSASKWNEQIKVEVDTLDNMIDKYGVPDFIKIDVEGFEEEVLKGLSMPVKSLSFEAHMQVIDSKFRCLETLSKIGFTKANITYGHDLKFVLDENIPINDMHERLYQLLERNPFGNSDIYVFGDQ